MDRILYLCPSMKPSPSISIGIAMFIIAVLILLQYLFIEFSWFNYFPYIGYLFHLIGGYCTAVIAFHLLVPKTLSLPYLVLLVYLSGAVALAAIGWEVLEYVFSPGDKKHLLNQNVYAVLEDQVISMLGGMLYWVRLVYVKK
ncbi:MAG: hypothetical protein U0U66_07700 [Cytophagaceae bacterium]